MTQTLVIERNIPLPRRVAPELQDGVRRTIEALEVGESFALPHGIRSPYSRVSNANVRLAPRRFSIRKVNREFRIWRTA